MASVKDLLLSSLEELVNADLELFQWHLVKDNECISKSEMEDANRLKTVDKLVDCFGPEAAVKITVSILRKMNQNELAERLENKHKQAQMSSGGHTGVSTVLNAQTGGTVNAPVLAGNTTGPVTFNYSTAGHDSHRLTLDLNTAHKSLRLSENNRVISGTLTDHPYPDHPDRFDVFEQVLCEESVSGPCYWEIELSGDAYISVSYKSISRKGRRNECLFGSNDQSWALYCSRSSFSFWHNNIQPNLSVKPIISRIGVYDDNISRIGVFVDPSAGTLSFYSVYRNTVTLIHSVHTIFTQPLYPGFRVGSGSSVKLY